ncbi:SprT-like domain-containing protein [Bradyrhizobium neotropicale]|uniref:SprT-like domain-containing protein n=1 Tax=Bradyrhizobium neotropicale TaxID=1497615 RepID=UPI001AD67D41|nr:SprT-like domain-containing protein [Bradyrhizobium neotropicale]MBO4228061.1 hypothetical protein [Bradyrhizobium neotropicale]
MTLRLTPKTLEAAYDYLRTTPPFDRWGLPPGGDVKFVVSKSIRDYAAYRWDGRRHTISLSAKGIGHSATLLLYVAHEMVHMYLEEKGWETRTGGPDTHNAAFRKFALQVCKAHGFDPKAFY